MTSIKLTEIEISNNKKLLRSTINQPYIRTENGKQYLCFRYTTRTARNELNPKFEEYQIQFDTENVEVENFSEKFREDNSIYPGANCDRSHYRGSRWDYESGCNELAWKFVYLNSNILYGKKGLIQRAVDTYRNINKLSRSRRIIRTERQIDDGLRRIGEMEIIPYVEVGDHKVRIDIPRSKRSLSALEYANRNMTFYLSKNEKGREIILNEALEKYFTGEFGCDDYFDTISNIVGKYYNKKEMITYEDLVNLIEL